MDKDHSNILKRISQLTFSFSWKSISLKVNVMKESSSVIRACIDISNQGKYTPPLANRNILLIALFFNTQSQNATFLEHESRSASMVKVSKIFPFLISLRHLCPRSAPVVFVLIYGGKDICDQTGADGFVAIPEREPLTSIKNHGLSKGQS